MSEATATLRDAEAFARQGRMAAAVTACYETRDSAPDDPRVHALLAHVFLDGDFYEEAIRAATRAIELDPDCGPGLLELGLAYDRRGGMWDQSILVWHELAEVAPGLVTAHVQLGEAFSAAQFEAEAIESWNAALQLDPHEPRAMYNLAVAALQREGLATALPGFRRAGELDASQDSFFFTLATPPAGDDEHGAGDADEAAQKSPRDESYDLALTLARSEDYFLALDAIRRILDVDPSDAAALALAAFVYLKQDSDNEAMALALRSLALSTRTPAAVYVLGAAFAKRPGLSRNATAVFGALTKAVPLHPMPHVLYAESLLGMQRYDEATQAYERAVELDPTLVRARFGLAAALLVQSEHARAHHQISRAAYHDTKQQGHFWRLYDTYAQGRDAT